ncbi:glutamine synthetase/guanido kinase [Hesseltinella vesiculosa]|uniref:Glutamine synthetase n=1 Tax=Hesseltinella vesiculosa TaxID=101127 RepID=A0A1X2GBP0_9FUNG|nr:glutamine synthetase/guanido kinase [Hesseltinella vesiculosa]
MHLTKDNIANVLALDSKVKVAAVDIDGVLRGKVMHKDKFLQIIQDGFGFCSVIFGWDIQDVVYTTDVEFGGDECQYPDMVAKVDLSSFRRIPWENNLAFFLVSLEHPETRAPLYACPRGCLKQAVTDLAELGYTAYSGVEFEFFCFKENATSVVEKAHAKLAPLTVGMCGYSLLRPSQNQDFYDHAFDWLKEFRVDMESWHTETGPGVFEAAIGYQEAMEAGDRATLFKTAMKQIALKHGFMASFMAKPYQQLPGCSGHMHFSLKDSQGRNAFAIWDDADASDVPHMSKTMVAFLAGVLRALPSILAILAPTINSYKRLCGNFWAPVTVSWGIENRLGAVRVIVPPTASKSSSRLEMRVSGADVNPHLALAAVLKCGYWGIKTNQTLPVAAMDLKNRDNHGQPLARTLQEAIVAMEQKDSLARQVLGNEFIDHFTKTRRHEWQMWQQAVTSYELERYLELV